VLDGAVVATSDDRHAAGFRVMGRPDIERVDIVAAPAEKAGHTREHAELVFHEHRDGMSHSW